MAELVEREAELEALAAARAAARAGQGGVVLIAGPAGIGKSALLDQACAAADGSRVLRARADDLERGLPFGVARQLFETLLRAASAPRRRSLLAGAAALGAGALGLDAAESTVPAGADPAVAAAHGLTWLTANVAGETPLVLAVDDVQWADSASLQWLGYLARRIGDLPVLLALTWREGTETDVLLDRLAADPATRLIRPAPLSHAGAAAMIGAEKADALWAATGGNPFLLVELARGGEETVQRSVARRLAQLSPPAGDVAEAVAVLGPGAELRHAAALAGCGAEDAAAAADALSRAEILRPGRPLAFVHPLVRDVVYDAISQQRRGLLHRDAARAHLAEGAPASQVAVHAAAAPPAADPEAARLLIAGADDALSRGAAIEALMLLERALAEPPVDDAVRAQVLGAMASLEHRLHRGDGDRLHAALALETDPVRRARLLEVRHQSLLLAGDADGAEAAAAEAAAQASGHDDDLALRLRARREAARISRDGVGAGLAPEVEAAAARASGATVGEVTALVVTAWAASLAGDRPADAVGDLLERAIMGGALDEGLDVDVVELFFGALAATWCERLDLADHLARGWRDAAIAQGSQIAYQSGSFMEAHVAMRRGDVRAAEAIVEVLQEVGRVRMSSTFSGFSTPLIRVLGHCGRADDALEISEEGARGGMFVASLQTAVAEIRALIGDWAGSAEAALAAHERLVARGGGRAPIAARPLAAIALAHLGRGREALALAEDAVIAADAWGTARARGSARHARGVAAGDIGELTAGVDLLRGPDTPLELIAAQLDLGAAHRRAGARRAAQEVLREALDLADRRGATALAGRAREELAAAGARPRRARLSGLDALTPAERRIAALAAEGRSNPEIAQALFLSRKTVEHHLSHAYAKLDVQSRGDLPAALSG